MIAAIAASAIFFLAISAPVGPELSLEKGLRLVYEVVPEDAHAGEYEFYVVLCGGGPAGRCEPLANRSRACEVVSKRLLLEVEALGAEGGRALVNLTLVFVDGRAECGRDYAPLPAVEGAWRKEGERYVASFGTLNVTRSLLVLLDDYDAVGATGERYGEWIFWIRPPRRRYVALLYWLEDEVEVLLPSELEISGTAALLLVDTLQREQLRVESGRAPPALPLERIYSNVTPDLAESIARAVLRRCEGGERVAEVFPIVYDSESRRLILFKDLLPELADLEGKPWRYLPEISRACSVVELNGTEVEECTIYPGVEYGGRVYSILLNLGLEEISYSSRGLLLYARFRVDDGNLYYALPSTLVKTFGIARASRAAGSAVSLRLVEVSSGTGS